MHSDDDDDDCDLRDLADGLLPAEPQDENAALVQDIAGPVQAEPDAISELTSGMLRPAAADPMLGPLPQSMSRLDRFGARIDLGVMGSVLQQQLYARYGACPAGCKPPEAVQTIMQKFVYENSLKSIQAAAETSRISRPWMAASLQHFCVLPVAWGIFSGGRHDSVPEGSFPSEEIRARSSNLQDALR